MKKDPWGRAYPRIHGKEHVLHCRPVGKSIRNKSSSILHQMPSILHQMPSLLHQMPYGQHDAWPSVHGQSWIASALWKVKSFAPPKITNKDAHLIEHLHSKSSAANCSGGFAGLAIVDCRPMLIRTGNKLCSTSKPYCEKEKKPSSLGSLSPSLVLPFSLHVVWTWLLSAWLGTAACSCLC
eukprot:306569-Pelagomonas_calceolata.AAC.7